MLGDDDAGDRRILGWCHRCGDNRGGGRNIERFGRPARAAGIQEGFTRFEGVWHPLDMGPHGPRGPGEGLGIGGQGLNERQQPTNLGLIERAIEQGEENPLAHRFIERLRRDQRRKDRWEFE